MTLSMERDYQLRWMDFDRHGRLQPAAALDIFQDVATMHANGMGIGRDDMVPRGVFWAVVRTKLEMAKQPAHFQTVTVRTWPHTPTRFSFLRDFTMRDQAGDLIAKATTEWVLMDIEARKFVSVKDYYDGLDDFDEARAFERKPRKIPDFEEGNRPVVEVVPRFSDIDVNGHVNNARYANYLMDALDPDSASAVKTLQLDYRHEALPGAPLAVHALAEDGRVLMKGVNVEGAIAFAGLVELA